MAKELAVAAVTEFPIFLGCGGGSARATLRAAVLILTKPLICLTGLWCMTTCTVWEFVTLAGRIPVGAGQWMGGSRWTQGATAVAVAWMSAAYRRRYLQQWHIGSG